MDEPHWQHFSHDADIGLRVIAPTRETLFELMGEALTAVVTSPELVRPDREREIHCEAPDDALLLVDWINALVYEMASERLLFGAWHVVLTGCRLDATVRGEPVDRLRHRPAVEVKGATYTGLQFGKTGEGLWRAQCVVDV